MATLLLIAVSKSSAESSITTRWQKSFGGTDSDVATAAKPTSDGGYILGGYSYSAPSETKSSPDFGGGDFWLVKLDANGNKQWEKSCGGTEFDGVRCVRQTTDGGYIAGGTSFSDVSGNKTSSGFGAADYWLVKFDSSGNKAWDKSFGGTSNDVLHCVQQTADGGYILGGTSLSDPSGNKSSASQGAGDYWIVKVDANGNKQWEKSFGGADVEELRGLQQTSDGGYIVGGSSFSAVSGNKSASNQGTDTSDYWVLKLDGNGNKQWEKAVGGDEAEQLEALEEVPSGYILAGTSSSGASGNKSGGNWGSDDYWIVKLDAAGNKQWEQSLGGDGADKLHSIQRTSDGGFLIGGISSSVISGSKSIASAGSDSGDYWIVKLNASGEKQWEHALPGNYFEEPSSLQATGNGDFVVIGLSTVLPTGDADYSLTLFSSPLQLSSFQLTLSHMFQIQLPASAATSYVLQATTNFITWTSIMTNAPVNGVVTLTDAAASRLPHRFYRVQQKP